MRQLLTKLIYRLAVFLRQLGFNFQEDADPRVAVMKDEIRKVGGKIEFKIEQYPDGYWTAESTNIDGIITGGKDVKEIPLMIRDAIFTYYSIPPHLCNDTLLRTDNEPVTLKQRVYV